MMAIIAIKAMTATAGDTTPHTHKQQKKKKRSRGSSGKGRGQEGRDVSGRNSSWCG